MNSTESTRLNWAAGSLPANDANSAPEMPAKNELVANAISLYRNSGTPITSAAMSRSRMAWSARPVRVRATFLAMTRKNRKITARKM